MSLQATDDAAAAVQKTPNRVTLEHIKSKVVRTEIIHPETAPHFTLALVHLENGFIVIGKSAPADPKNFDEAYGREQAFEDALRQVWGLEGYLLRERLHGEEG
jgi:hypothetical protein